MRASNSAKYESLEQVPDDGISKVSSEDSEIQPKRFQEDNNVCFVLGSATNHIIYWSTVVIAVCAVIDVGAFLCVTFGSVKGRWSDQVDIEDLPFRNSYVGLSRLYADPNSYIPPRNPISNVPARLFPVDTTSKPHRLTLKAKEYRRTQYGMMWLNDQAFELGPSVSRKVKNCFFPHHM